MCSQHGDLACGLEATYFLHDEKASSVMAPGRENSPAVADDVVKASNGTIGYVLMGYPRISETFITHEIYQLERLGMNLRIFAVKQGDTDKVHDVVKEIKAPLTYLPKVTSLSGTGFFRWMQDNFPKYSHQHLRLLKARPRVYLSTLSSAIAMSWRYRKNWHAPRKVFIKEFMQAGHIAMQVLDEGSIKHLHGHFCHGATTITWMASRLTGLPYSFTAHAKDIYQTDQNPRDLLSQKLNTASFVTTCTGANLTHLDEHFPQCGHVHKIYHGLDTDYFSPGPARDVEKSVPQILSVGRFVEKKGFQFLIRACALLKEQGIPFRCKILGEQGDHYPVIAQLISEYGLQDQVTLHEPVTHDELLKLYRESDIFTLPCQIAADGDRDGIPNVLAEAMSTGLAAVTTGISGIPELVRNTIDGIIVPQKEFEPLASALRKLIENPALRRELGNAGRERIRQVFDSRRTTVQLRDLFLETMQMEAERA